MTRRSNQSRKRPEPQAAAIGAKSGKKTTSKSDGQHDQALQSDAQVVRNGTVVKQSHQERDEAIKAAKHAWWLTPEGQESTQEFLTPEEVVEAIDVLVD